MNCTIFRNSIIAWVENDFSSFSVDEFEAHSKECVHCSYLLEEFSKTMEIIEQDKLSEPDPFAETRILQRIENHLETERWWILPNQRTFLRPIYLGIGITIAILLGVMVGFEGSGINKIGIANNNDIESFRSELNMPDMMNEDVIQFSNQ